MHKMPYWATYISTAKQGIPKRSAVSNTTARVDEVEYLPEFRGLPAPKGLAISQIFIHRSVQLKTLIQLKKFDVSS